MTLQEFKSKATARPVNTTNGWGFAGYYGTIYDLGQFTIRKAKWSYRHAPSTNYDGYYIYGYEVTRDQFLEALSTCEIDLDYEPFVTDNYIYGFTFRSMVWENNKLVNKY